MSRKSRMSRILRNPGFLPKIPGGNAGDQTFFFLYIYIGILKSEAEKFLYISYRNFVSKFFIGIPIRNSYKDSKTPNTQLWIGETKINVWRGKLLKSLKAFAYGGVKLHRKNCIQGL